MPESEKAKLEKEFHERYKAFHDTQQKGRRFDKAAWKKYIALFAKHAQAPHCSILAASCDDVDNNRYWGDMVSENLQKLESRAQKKNRLGNGPRLKAEKQSRSRN